MKTVRTPAHVTVPLSRPLLALCGLGLTLALSGCASSLSHQAFSTGGSGSALRISGNVHGGQQPVTGSSIQLYTVGTSGLKSASTPLIGSTVTSDSNGNFSITGTYSCTGATEVYITASGGNPGNGVNSAITLAAALGPCSALTPATFIEINEITTVAAAYALAPFASDLAHVGAVGANSAGITEAFANAATLSNVASGSAGGAGLGAGVTVPVAELNTLGDILAACVNTTGPGSSECMTLFAATSASDTFGAALGIARNPGASAVVALYTLPNANSPFHPTLTGNTAPNDFTVAVTTSGNGTLATPYGIAVDASGDAWVTNESGSTIDELSPAGALLANPSAAGLYGAQGVAIDRGGNVWVANTAGNSVLKFSLTGGAVTTSSAYTAGGIDAPSSIALDSGGNAFIANFNGNSISKLTAAGAAAGGSPFTVNGAILLPAGIAVGPAGSVYVTSGNGSVVELTNAGALSATLSDAALQGTTGLAVDSSGRVLATGFTTGASLAGALSEFSSTGVPVFASPVQGGLSNPMAVATDGVSIWVASAGGLAQFAYGASTPVSPASGYGSLNAPAGVALDASGSVWTANSGSNTVSKFIGLALPVTTPLAANVGP